MGYTTSTVHGIEVPDSAEANNVPEDIGKVVTALEAGSLVKRLTGAQISALTAPQKPAGLVVYNTTTSRLQISDGSNFHNVVDVRGSGAIAMGNTKITGLAAATANGDAVRYEQALLLAGGTMTGAIAMGGNKVTGLAAASTNGDAVRYQQLPVYGTATCDSSGNASISFPGGRFSSAPVVVANAIHGDGTFVQSTFVIGVTFKNITTSGAQLHCSYIVENGSSGYSNEPLAYSGGAVHWIAMGA
jgi:hypothetical protein